LSSVIFFCVHQIKDSFLENISKWKSISSSLVCLILCVLLAFYIHFFLLSPFRTNGKQYFLFSKLYLVMTEIYRCLWLCAKVIFILTNYIIILLWIGLLWLECSRKVSHPNCCCLTANKQKQKVYLNYDYQRLNKRCTRFRYNFRKQENVWCYFLNKIGFNNKFMCD
jgi:hypothetical protein